MGAGRKFNYMNLLLVLVFVVGLGILLYPNISDFFNQRNSSKSISEYDETVAALPEVEAELERVLPLTGEIFPGEIINESFSLGGGHSVKTVV